MPAPALRGCVSVYLDKSDGTFAVPRKYIGSDLNGDGKLDIAAGDGGLDILVNTAH